MAAQDQGKQLTLRDVGIAPTVASVRNGNKQQDEPGDPIEDWRTQITGTQRADMDRACSYNYTCAACVRGSMLKVLHRDGDGKLKPIKCRMCGAARRPGPGHIWCIACNCLWAGCVGVAATGQAEKTSKTYNHAPMATLDRGPTLGACPIQFATDFSGMDMTAFALAQLLPDDGLVEQQWACDFWI